MTYEKLLEEIKPYLEQYPWLNVAIFIIVKYLVPMGIKKFSKKAASQNETAVKGKKSEVESEVEALDIENTARADYRPFAEQLEKEG